VQSISGQHQAKRDPASDFDRFTAALLDYTERNPGERTIVSRFFNLLEEWPACLSRNALSAHLTGSAWVTHERSVLLVHHRKLDRWLQPGGHADEDSDIPGTALREAQEETGMNDLDFFAPDRWEIFDLDIHQIPEYGPVSEHEHFDVRFRLTAARQTDPVPSDESHDARWVLLDDLERYSDEESVVRMRRKLNPRYQEGRFSTR